MRARSIVLGLFALLLVPLFNPTPASALSCVDPATAFDVMDVVVRATVTNRPSQYQMVVVADRYYKNIGPATIQAGIQGIKPGNSTWMDDPIPGKTYLIGFVNQEGKLVHRPCDIFIELNQGAPPPHLVAKMGEGNPPVAAVPGGRKYEFDAVPAVEAKPSRLWLLLAAGAAALTVIAAGRLLLRTPRS